MCDILRDSHVTEALERKQGPVQAVAKRNLCHKAERKKGCFSLLVFPESMHVCSRLYFLRIVLECP